MFLHIALTIFALFPYCTNSTEVAPHVTVNVNNNWQSTNTNQNSNTSTAEVTTIEVNKLDRIRAFLENDGIEYYHRTQTGLWHYKYHIIGATLVSIYATLFYQLFCAIRFMQHHAIWASWHKELTLQELLAYDIEALTQELLIAIQVRYSNENNPTDFILPLVEFNAAIQHELETLNYYKKIYEWCKKLYLINFMPIGTKRLDLLPEHIERATYLQTLFKNWAAHHNLACQTQCHQPQSISQKIRRFLGI